MSEIGEPLRVWVLAGGLQVIEEMPLKGILGSFFSPFLLRFSAKHTTYSTMTQVHGDIVFCVTG